MKRLLIAAMTMALGVTSASGQSLEDLNIQIHGYATQGFLYTTQNNYLGTTSSNGSPNWSEAVVNLGAQPSPKLRIGVQLRYELLGNYTNAVTVDWAAADYKVDDRFGVRFGKVKIPSNLFNETQDIDPSYQWGLLPQSVYPITSRNGQLSAYGGVVYGTFKLTPKLGKLEYRAWSGEDVQPSDDGYFLGFKEAGLTLPNGFAGMTNGVALHWKTPLPGLMIGASENHKNASQSSIDTTVANNAGNFLLKPYNIPAYFARYEKNKIMVAAEYQRESGQYAFQFAGAPPAVYTKYKPRAEYVMASYKVTEKFVVGVYNSQYVDHRWAFNPARYSKDWAVSTRYDFGQFMYAKAEEHFIDGTGQGYDPGNNTSLKTKTHLTILKIGVSF